MRFDSSRGVQIFKRNLYVRPNLCHNPKCSNPEHLTKGTHADNWNDSKEIHIATSKERRTLSDRRLLSKKLNTKPTNNRGTLKRSTNKGVIAMALYNCRNERHITPIEIKKLVSMEQTSNIHAQLEEMTEKGYLDKIKINQRSFGFKWSNKFAYPFQDIQVADKSLVLLDFKDLEK